MSPLPCEADFFIGIHAAWVRAEAHHTERGAAEVDAPLAHERSPEYGTVGVHMFGAPLGRVSVPTSALHSAGSPDGMAIEKQSLGAPVGVYHTHICNKILKKYLSFAIFRHAELYYNRGKQ